MSRFMGLVLAVVVLVAFSAQIQPVQAQCFDAQGRNCAEATVAVATATSTFQVTVPQEEKEPFPTGLKIILATLAACVVGAMFLLPFMRSV